MNEYKEALALLLGKRLLSRQDLARRYEVEIHTIDRWRRAGKLPRPKYINGPRWTPNEILQFEKRHAKRAVSQSA